MRETGHCHLVFGDEGGKVADDGPLGGADVHHQQVVLEEGKRQDDLRACVVVCVPERACVCICVLVYRQVVALTLIQELGSHVTWGSVGWWVNSEWVVSE